MKKLVLTFSIILFMSVLTYAQENTEAQLKESQVRLVKTLDALEKAEALNKSLQTENQALIKLNDTNNQIIGALDKQLKAKDTEIEAKDKEIEILKRKSERKISILFGFIKIRF